MDLTLNGIRHFLAELTKFFLNLEKLLQENEENQKQIKLLNERIEALTKKLELSENELLLIKDRARREVGIIL